MDIKIIEMLGAIAVIGLILGNSDGFVAVVNAGSSFYTNTVKGLQPSDLRKGK